MHGAGGKSGPILSQWRFAMRYEAIIYSGDRDYEPRATGASDTYVENAILEAEENWFEKFGEDTGYTTHWIVYADGEPMDASEVDDILLSLAD